MRLVVAAACVAVFAGCTVDELDFTGKACPSPNDCPAGYTCNADKQCVRPGGSSGSLCAFVPAKFRVDWVTPNTIRWRWDSPTDGSAFQRYEVLLGKGDPMSADTSKPDSTWTATQNAELGEYTLLHTEGAADLVRATVVDGLVPHQLYWGQLLAYDVSGCAARSDVVGALTADEPTGGGGAGITVFHDDLPPSSYLDSGGQGPFDLDTNPADCFAGSAACLSFTPSCTCNDTLHVEGLDVDLSAIGADLGKTAFFEMAFLASARTDWATIQIGFASQTKFFGVQPYSITKSGGYRVLQIPLDAFEDGNGMVMTTAALADHLTQFTINAEWIDGAPGRIDEVRIRW